MSRFLAVAFSSSAIASPFLQGLKFSLKDISSTPFGLAVLGGKRAGYSAFLCTLYGDSMELWGRESASMIAFVEQLLSVSPTVRLCCRWFRGEVVSEKVKIQGKEILSVSELGRHYPDFREDVVYVVMRDNA